MNERYEWCLYRPSSTIQFDKAEHLDNKIYQLKVSLTPLWDEMNFMAEFKSYVAMAGLVTLSCSMVNSES